MYLYNRFYQKTQISANFKKRIVVPTGLNFVNAVYERSFVFVNLEIQVSSVVAEDAAGHRWHVRVYGI